MQTLLILLGVLIVAVLVIGVLVSRSSDKDDVDERLDSYLDGMSEFEDATSPEQEQMQQVREWVNDRVEKSSYGDKLQQELAKADMKLRAGEFITIQIGSAFGTGVVAFILSGGLRPEALIDVIIPMAFFSLGLIVGPFIPRIVLGRAQKTRLKRFSDQLPDMLNLMVNGLRAGFSTMQAMEAISREMPSPIKDEFRRVVQEMQLGIPMEKALDNLLQRIPSEDLDLVVTAINVQREVGGNLAEILETISHTVRERIRIKGEVKAITGQVRYSGTLISLLPVFLTGGLFMLNREYVMNFFNPETRNIGIPLLICSAIMIVIGYFAMQKVADIEV